MLKVIDTDTDRTGKLVRTDGYVMGGSYVNPSWEIQWDDWPDDDTPECPTCLGTKRLSFLNDRGPCPHCP